ncbi:hypothetical protein QTV34_002057 [Vibrio parahaemolyticus]|nr:hypothetical protein [Vibrio parahaemolyticus]
MKKTTLMLSAIALTISSSIQAHEVTLENVARDFAPDSKQAIQNYVLNDYLKNARLVKGPSIK